MAERLAGLGYAPVDEPGQRGTVLLAPDGSHALKLFPDDDLAYLSLARYAADNPSPHLPRVLHGPVQAGDGWAVALERLEPLPPDGEEAMLDEVEGYLLAVLNGDTSTVEPGRNGWGSGLGVGLRETLLGIGLTLLRGHGFHPDASDGNVMSRGDVPVLSDVVCGRNGRAYESRGEIPFDPGIDALLVPAAPSP